MMVLLLLASVQAAPPGPIVAVVSPPETPVDYESWAASEGREGAARVLPCDTLTEALTLCYKVELDGIRRLVTFADLDSWSMDRAALRTAAADGLEPESIKRVEIEGGGHYWMVEASAGRAAAVYLHPEWLSVAGPALRIASPARDVVLFWSGGDDELDRIMAVGARRIYEQPGHPVSPVVLTSTPTGWATWGQATPPKESPPGR